MTQYSPTTTEVKEMFGSIAGRYDITNTVLSFGMHHLWKFRLVRLLAQDNSKKVLDLCTGTGDLLPLLAKRFGDVTGADFCEPMLNVGREKYKGRGYNFVQADAASLPFEDASFDIVTVSFGVRNFKDLKQGLSEIRRVLTPDGTLLVLEFGQPKNFLFRSFYNFYSKYIIPIIGGIMTGNRSAYTYLPQTSKTFPCGKAFEEILSELNFIKPESQPATFGIAYLYKASK